MDFNSLYAAGPVTGHQSLGFVNDPTQLANQQRQFGFQSEQAEKARQFQGQQAQLGRQFQGQQAEAQRQLELQQSQIAAGAQEYAPGLQQQRFNTLLPMFQGAYGTLQNAAASGTGAGAGTPTGAPSPEITVGGVLNPQQVQQQVNAGRASTDQATATRMRQNAGQAAGRGFAAQSPLLAALNQNAWGQGMAANVANERETRLGAAQQNAQQLLSTQQARESQFASRQQEALQQQQIAAGQRNALLAALAGML